MRRDGKLQGRWRAAILSIMTIATPHIGEAHTVNESVNVSGTWTQKSRVFQVPAEQETWNWSLEVNAVGNWCHVQKSQVSPPGWSIDFDDDKTGYFVVAGQESPWRNFQAALFLGQIHPCGEGEGEPVIGDREVDAETDSEYFVLPSYKFICVNTTNTVKAVDGEEPPNPVLSDWSIDEGSPVNFISATTNATEVQFTVPDPGEFTITGTSTNNTEHTDSAVVTVLKVEIIDNDGGSVDKLSIGLWENAFDNPDSDPELKTDFIDEDPRRFFVRVTGFSEDPGNLFDLKLHTESPDSNYEQAETVVPLEWENGQLLSKSMLMVSDTVDQGAEPGRTILSMLGSDVIISLVGGDQNGVSCSSVASVPAEDIKSITIRPLIVKYFDTDDSEYKAPETAATVQTHTDICQTIYAQTAIQVNADAVSSYNQPDFGWDGWDEPDPEEDNVYLNMFTVEHEEDDGRVSETARKVIDDIGEDEKLRVFFVKGIARLSFVHSGGTKAYRSDYLGAATFPLHFDKEDPEYMGFAFVRGSDNGGAAPNTMAHELGHILCNSYHHPHEVNIMYAHPPWNGQVTDGKRWTEGQQQTIRGSNYVD